MPIWQFSQGLLVGDTQLATDLLQAAGGAPLGAPYVAPIIMPSRGKILFSATSPKTALIVLPNGITIPIQRFQF
jgi:hypothetical protein